MKGKTVGLSLTYENGAWVVDTTDEEEMTGMNGSDEHGYKDGRVVKETKEVTVEKVLTRVSIVPVENGLTVSFWFKDMSSAVRVYESYAAMHRELKEILG